MSTNSVYSKVKRTVHMRRVEAAKPSTEQLWKIKSRCEVQLKQSINRAARLRRIHQKAIKEADRLPPVSWESEPQPSMAASKREIRAWKMEEERRRRAAWEARTELAGRLHKVVVSANKALEEILDEVESYRKRIAYVDRKLAERKLIHHAA